MPDGTHSKKSAIAVHCGHRSADNLGEITLARIPHVQPAVRLMILFQSSSQPAVRRPLFFGRNFNNIVAMPPQEPLVAVRFSFDGNDLKCRGACFSE
jgi:hypothetical protein